MGAPQWSRLERLAEREVRKGIHVRILAGERLMFSFIRFQSHSTVPVHQHPHEQIGIVLEGELEMWISGERRMLRKGDAYAIPPNVPHSGKTKDTACLVADAFHPLREDYIKLFAAHGPTSTHS